MQTRKHNLSLKSIFTYCLFTLFSLGVWTDSSAQIFQETQKVNHANPAGLDYFGRTVAISENYALVGTTRREDYGVAYLYQKDPLTETWTLLKTLQSNDRVLYERFSWAMVITDDYAIISAATKDGARGAVYIFYKDHGGVNNWGQFKKIQSSDIEGGDNFGVGLDVSNDYLVVGAHRESTGGTSVGAAYIFHKDHGGADNWGEIKKIQANDGAEWDQFGQAVAIYGENVIVGASPSGGDTGGAYIFSKNHGGADNWGLVKKIQSSDLEAKDRFGWKVAITDDYAIATAWAEDGRAGSVYIFHKDHGGANNWGEVKKIQASDKQANAQFGVSMSLSEDNYLLISAPLEGECELFSGAVYLFHKDEGGVDNWGEVQKITTSDKELGDGLGQNYGTAISCSNVLLGAWHEDTQVFGSGAAYFFKLEIGGDTAHCSGDESIQLDAGAWASYNWSTGATTRYIIAISGGTYTVSITTAEGCTNVAEITVGEYTCEAETASLALSANTICVGEDVEITATDWKGKDDYVQHFLFFEQANTALTLIQNDQLSCTEIKEEGNTMQYNDLAAGEYLICAYSESVRCSPSPSPLSDILGNIEDIGSDQSGCHAIECATVVVAEPFVINEEATGASPPTSTGMNLYTVEVCGGAAPYGIDFSFSGGFASANVVPTVNIGCMAYQISYANGADWDLTLTDGTDCNEELLFSSEDLPAGPPQIVAVTATPETCPGDEDGALSITVEGGADDCGDYTYTWTGPNGFSQTVTDVATGSSIDDLVAGAYNVTVTDCNGMTAVQTGINIGRLGTGGRSGRGRGGCKTAESINESLIGNLKVYPNPFSQRTLIEWSVAETSNVWLSVYAVDGRQVVALLEGESVEGGILQRMNLEGHNLQAGVYVLQLQTDSGMNWSERLVVLD